ncbi:MAG: hypothetical protein ABIJ21_07545 [Nanoarchaeota archaeon]
MENNQSNQTLSDYITIALQNPHFIFLNTSERRTRIEPVTLAFVKREEHELHNGNKAWVNIPNYTLQSGLIKELRLDLLSNGYTYSINARYDSPYIITPEDKEKDNIPQIENTRTQLQKPPKSWKIFGTRREKDLYQQGWMQLRAETKIPQKAIPENKEEAEMRLTTDLTKTLQGLTKAIEAVNQITRETYPPKGEIQLAHMTPWKLAEIIYQGNPKTIAKSYDIFTINNIPVYTHYISPHVGNKKLSTASARKSIF